MAITFEQLCANSRKFQERITMPTRDNQLAVLGADPTMQREIEEHANATRIIIHPKVLSLAQQFMDLKRRVGTPKEQEIYQGMDVPGLFDRLLKQRPLVFFTPYDAWTNKQGQQGQGGFEHVGTDREQPNLPIANCLTYDEMAVSALLGVSVPTHFINNGMRHNRGYTGPPGTFERKGVSVASVGARFEKRNLMESRHMLVSYQCTAESGYGPDADPNSSAEHQLLALWAQFYGIGYFPSFDQAKAAPEKYIQVRGTDYLNVEVYKLRIRMSIEPFLLDANDRAKTANKMAYVHAVGLGLGVWMVSEKQAALMVQVYSEVAQERDLRHVSDIDFSWFPPDCVECGGAKDGQDLSTNGNRIRIHFSRRSPADAINDPNKLLVAMYPWDSNSYPGNEYWRGQLTASGDPAAACCCCIPELQNPEINTVLNGSNYWCGPDAGHTPGAHRYTVDSSSAAGAAPGHDSH